MLMMKGIWKLNCFRLLFVATYAQLQAAVFTERVMYCTLWSMSFSQK